MRELRRRSISDDALAGVHPALPAEVLGAEARELYIQLGPEHGDLHGANVLVRSDDDPVLTDFGSLCRSALALDPVTLELSLIFHPRGPFYSSGWPDDTAATDWLDLEAWVRGCPHEAFIRDCRAWAHERSSDQEMRAIVYSYAAAS